MMSGTSTGSILAGALAVHGDGSPDEPKFWAKEAVQIYIDGGPIIFDQNKVGKAMQSLCYIGFVIVFTGLFFLYGNYRYNNKSKRQAMDHIHEFLTE